MKNKKGFTLVELLAVVVILALIALIASPIILSIIENSRKSSFADSVAGVKRGIENFYSTHYAEDDFDKKAKYKYENGRLYYEGTLGGKTNPTVEMTGTLGGGKGEGQVDEDGNVTFAVASNGFCGSIGPNGVRVEKLTTEAACLK